MNSPRMTRRRLAVAVIAVIAVFAVFLVRLVDIQLVRADDLNAASRDKRAVPVTTYAARGDIVDNSGDVLAGSVMRYDLTVSPMTIIDAFDGTDDDVAPTLAVAEVSGKIAAVTGQTQAEVLGILTKDPESNFAYVAKSLTLEQWRTVRDMEIPGIYKEDHPIRTYPGGSVAGNLVGFVGTEGPQAGLELTSDACLASTNGISTYERSLDGIRLPGSTVTEQEAISGGTLMTTIDTDLQWSVQQMIAEQGTAIGAQKAMASVIEIKTGKVLAMADWPSVDPNNKNASKPDEFGSLAFSTPYEPGSIYKPMTAAMLIDAGKARPTDRIWDPYVWTSPEGARVRDAAAHPDQGLTLAGVIQQSSNVGISQFAVRLPNSVRYDYMTKFGVGQPTGIDFAGESLGIFGKDWTDQQKYDVSYGQGVSSTLAQISGIYQAIGNDGVKIPLTLVTGCTKPDGTIVDVPAAAPVRVVSEAAATQTLEMMEGVVTGGGLAKELQIPGYRVAAKSGTAEVAVNGRYTSDRIVSLAGMAPAEDPQYAVVVTYVKPATMKTSAAAAPTFKKIMTHVLKTYRVTPSTTPPPVLPTTW